MENFPSLFQRLILHFSAATKNTPSAEFIAANNMDRRRRYALETLGTQDMGHPFDRENLERVSWKNRQQ